MGPEANPRNEYFEREGDDSSERRISSPEEDNARRMKVDEFRINNRKMNEIEEEDNDG